MAKIHQLHREQIIDTDLDSAWDFISNPHNLDRITPDEVNFEIVSDLPGQMYNGLMIQYRIGMPFLGQQNWLTEIKHICEHHSFVDEQRIGPYRLWYHYHEITEQTGGVRFLDHVHFALPFGLLGEMAHACFVKEKLQHIFNYREIALLEILSNPLAHHPPKLETRA